MSEKTNRLANSQSPYLLQHAHHPVDWHEWDEAAFAKARDEDKPIFLSIGYSTCHWCHVMAHESFENAEVAARMNEAFICIKVDREERPDIDQIYMTVCQMMTGSGGWPLTIIMTPDKKPFFTATYIPRETRYNRLGMLDLIPRIAAVWNNQRNDVLLTAGNLFDHLQKHINPNGPTDEATSIDGIFEAAYRQLARQYDPEYGGFGQRPKFPTPHNYLFLLRYWQRTGEKFALEIVDKSLHKMRLGGIFDHLGFGFHRYSTDRTWLLPHFEKMLYDQAMLLMAYTEAYAATRNEEYRPIAHEIVDYVERVMTDETGGFFSAEDADSEGEEGKFYVWPYDELMNLLGKELGQLFCQVYQIKPEGNYVEEATGHATGWNIPHLTAAMRMYARKLGLPERELQAKLEIARRTLFNHREKRIHPGKDDKILTDWNGLMMAALALAGRIFGQKEFIALAQTSADFISRELTTVDGRLLHRFRRGQAGITANLDDYAFLIWGLLELYQTTFELGYLQGAVQLNRTLIRWFQDNANGGFFFTPHDGEELLVRSKDVYDGAIPSGNSVAIFNLLRIGKLTGDPALTRLARQAIHAFLPKVVQAPALYTQFLNALDFDSNPGPEILIVGEADDITTQRMLEQVNRGFSPNRMVLLKTDHNSDALSSIAPFAAGYRRIENRSTAYICRDYACQQPTTDLDQFTEMLDLFEAK